MFGLVADTSIRIVAAAAAVGLVLVILRVRSGAARHAAWSAVLLVMLTMPLLTAIVPRVDVPVPSTLALDLGPVAGPADSHLGPLATPSRDPVQAPPAAGSTPPADHRPAATPVSAPFLVDWRAIAAAGYAGGVMLFVVQLAAGWLLARRLVVNARRATIQNRWPVLESGAVATPLTTGILSPAVVLPVSWREWPGDKLEAVLAHENAHIARRDALVAVVAHLNRAIFWFHPLAWWLERTLARHAEHACDETAARAVGQPRRYAEMLVDMAEAVHRRGHRVSWQAIGVDGSGLLGARIDRVLRGDVMIRMSRGRRLSVAAGCATVLLLAIACRQQIAPTPLREDPALAKQLAEQPERTKRFEAARDLTPAEADVLEARISTNPDDWDARERLVTYYQASTTVAWDKKVAGLRRHALWLIQHHPEHEIAPPPLSPQYDPDGFAEAARLWDVNLQKPEVSPFMVSRAAQFFARYDPARAEPLILRGMAMDPKCEALKARTPPNVGEFCWPAQLGELYGRALLGPEERRAGQQDSAVARSPLSLEVRRKLDASTDPLLLTRTGAYLVRMSTMPDGSAEARALGKSYLERALALKPDMVGARRSLFFLEERERARRIHDAEQAKRPVDEADRLWDLAMKAQFALMGRAPFTIGRIRRPAETTRNGRASSRKKPWQLPTHASRIRRYSRAVMIARQTLAAVAAYENDRDAAVRLLNESLDVPPSDEVRYYAQGTWIKAVNQLLKLGERERVAAFLDASASVTETERERMLADAKAIREGRMPTTYQYMVAREARR